MSQEINFPNKKNKIASRKQIQSSLNWTGTRLQKPLHCSEGFQGHWKVQGAQVQLEVRV